MTGALVHKDRSKWYGPDGSVPLTIEHPNDRNPGPEERDDWREATEAEYQAFYFYWSEMCGTCGDDRGGDHDDSDHPHKATGSTDYAAFAGLRESWGRQHWYDTLHDQVPTDLDHVDPKELA